LPACAPSDAPSCVPGGPGLAEPPDGRIHTPPLIGFRKKGRSPSTTCAAARSSARERRATFRAGCGVRDVVCKTRVPKPPSCHTFRHYFATHRRRMSPSSGPSSSSRATGTRARRWFAPVCATGAGALSGVPPTVSRCPESGSRKPLYLSKQRDILQGGVTYRGGPSQRSTGKGGQVGRLRPAAVPPPPDHGGHGLRLQKLTRVRRILASHTGENP
jgi:hypothetical protein